MSGKVIALDKVLSDIGLTADTSAEEATQRMVCFLYAHGDQAATVCKKMRMSLDDVEKIIKSDAGVDLILGYQAASGISVKERLERIRHAAIDAQMRIMLTSKSDLAVLKAADSFLDRSMGKATQVVETHSMSSVGDGSKIDERIAAAMKRLEQLEATRKKLQAANETKKIAQ